MPESTPTSRARQLRRQSTDAERALWKALRNRQVADYKLRRQLPIGPYIADFACWELGLIVELDGGHHLERTEYDRARTAYLESVGFKVLRFWNDQVLLEMDVVLETILEALKGAPSP
jgi:very-short-patch-repair endonuclease